MHKYMGLNRKKKENITSDDKMKDEKREKAKK